MKIDKPISMPVKDYLYKTLAIRLNIPSQTIDKVITHSFESAHKAMKGKHHSVEITGFGKFLFNIKKASKKLDLSYHTKKLSEEKLLQPLTEKEVNSATRALNIANEVINQLEPKVYGKNK